MEVSGLLAERELNAPESRKRALYAAFDSRDQRFDGQVFVGVSSTGIYCRTVCTAHMPKYENCTFFHTAAEAEDAGYRPCMTCRPEVAPGLSNVDATTSLARRAAVLLRENCASGESLDKLAARLGYTDRHLRRAFVEEFSVTPVQYLQTCRLLLAKSLLTDSSLPVSAVAQAAGFGSVRRMNHLFKERYRLSPTDLRKRVAKRGSAGEGGVSRSPQASQDAMEGGAWSLQAVGEGGVQGSQGAQDSQGAQGVQPLRAARVNADIRVKLGYRTPYRFDDLLAFFRARTLEGVELVGDDFYARTVKLPHDGGWATGWLRVEDDPRRSALVLAMSDSLLPVLPQVIARVRRQFDVDCDPVAVRDGIASLDDVVPGAAVPGTRLPGCFEPFETACRAILGQQVSVAAANKLAARVVRAYGTPVDTGIEGLERAFPTPAEIGALCASGSIEDALGPLGVIKTRSRVIAEMARLLEAGELDFGAGAVVAEQMERLLSVKGIGPWTANYIAMRAFSFPDAFLETDAGVKHALPGRTPTEIAALAEAWHPWRSYANICLWNSLA